MTWGALLGTLLTAIAKAVIDHASKPKTGVVASGDLGGKLSARLRKYQNDSRAGRRSIHITGTDIGGA